MGGKTKGKCVWLALPRDTGRGPEVAAPRRAVHWSVLELKGSHSPSIGLIPATSPP